MTKRVLTPTSKHFPTDPELGASIHETQNSLDTDIQITAVSGVRGTEAKNPSPSSPLAADETLGELEQRVAALETQQHELNARLRLLEKQAPGAQSLLHWLALLLFFVALAVTWRLLFSPR